MLILAKGFDIRKVRFSYDERRPLRGPVLKHAVISYDGTLPAQDGVFVQTPSMPTPTGVTEEEFMDPVSFNVTKSMPIDCDEF